MIRVLGDRVLVLLPPKAAETTSAGGIVLVKDPEQRAPTRGIVVRLGDKRDTVRLADVCARIQDECHAPRKVADLIAAVSKLAPAPFDVAVEDVVLFAPSAGDAFEYDGQRYVILHESEIHGVLKPLSKTEAA